MSRANQITKVKRRRELSQNYQLWLFLLPGFLCLLIFNYAPMYGLLIAFKDYKMMIGVTASKWVGLENFRDIFSDTTFLNSFKNTLVISALKLCFGFPMPVVLALLLNEMKNMHIKKGVQTLSYLPHFFSWVVLAGIFKMLLSSTGPINSIITSLGGTPISFFGDKKVFLATLILTDIWQSVGWSSIVYLATLSGIDQSLYEAASIDGASKFKQVIHITLPSLLPTIITVFILRLGSVLNSGFDQIYNMQNAIVYEVSDVLDTFVLRQLNNAEFTAGTTVGLFKSVVCIILVVLTNKITNKLSGNEQGIW